MDIYWPIQIKLEVESLEGCGKSFARDIFSGAKKDDAHVGLGIICF